MALKEGDVYECPDPNCGCQVTVTKTGKDGGTAPPRCCCGKAMVKK
jgi:hypothetical protein